MNAENDEVTYWLSGEVTLAAADIQTQLSPNSENTEDLKLAGIDDVIALIALKFIVGIVSGFLGKAAYSLWQEARTRKQFEQLKIKLQAPSAELGSAGEIDEETIRHDVIESLVGEGLTPTQASLITDKAIERIKLRIAR